MSDEFMQVKDIAELLGVSVDTVHARILDSGLPGINLGAPGKRARWVFRKSSVMDWIDEREKKTGVFCRERRKTVKENEERRQGE